MLWGWGMEASTDADDAALALPQLKVRGEETDGEEDGGDNADRCYRP